MSIYTNKSGTVTEIAPRLKRNGAIMIPFSAWTKKDGVLKKVWDRYPYVKPLRIITEELESGVWYFNTSRRRGARIMVDLTDTRIPTTDTGQIIISCDNSEIIGYPLYDESGVTIVQYSLAVERTASLTFLIGKASVTSGVQESAYTGWEYKRFTFYVGNETEKLTVQTANTYQSGAWSPAP